MNPEHPDEDRAGKLPELDWLEAVKQSVGSLRFGQVTIIVHNAQVVQIERIERLRLNKHPENPNSTT
jgi:hypothetical protein